MRLLPFLLAGFLLVISCTDDNVKPPDIPGNGGEGGDTTGAIFLGRPPAVINEVYSANADLKDEFGGDPGWVEFYNPADTAVNLNGYYLTNNALRKLWRFGDVEIGPRGYAVVFLSGRDKPDLEPPRDSIDLIRSTIGGWSWADSQIEPPDKPGRSTASWEFEANTSVGGTITTKDNQPVLTWASAEVVMKLYAWGDASVLDLSRVNQILLRGRINKGAALQVGLIQPDVAGHLGWSTVLTGSGAENELYTIDLPSGNGGLPDLKNISAVRFASVANIFETIDFKFNSIVARKRGSNIHAPFELSDRGGRLFLLDEDGYIRDSAAYPAATLGLSYARTANGKWELSKPPTPYADNSPDTYIGQVQPPSSVSIPNSGYYEGPLTFTLPRVSDNIFIACDTTGFAPTAESKLQSGATLSLTKTTMMRCAQFMAGAYPSEIVMRTYIIGERLPSLPVVSIAVDPHDMFDPAGGLYSMGPNASPVFPYQGANFWRDTELPVQLEFFEGGAKHAWSYRAGLRIFGNWSKGNPKKSVLITFREAYGQSRLRYGLFPSHPRLTVFKHFILRNNGNNFDQDYIRDMLMTSLTEGLGVDYQKGRAVIVYYNGQYWGIHNLRERANGDYFETNYGVGEERIDLVKAGGDVSSGSDVDYQNIYNWVSAVTLTDENLRMLEERVDVDDFTYNHIARIYYNDRDWPGNNMKRWRVNSPPSRWKWLMYDTDHGWDSHGQWEQPTLGALAFATRADGPDWPNPPHTTLMLRKLLENEGYKNSFINRFSLLLATYFAPGRVSARIDALMAPIESEVPRDQQRWNQNAGRMSDQLAIIRGFGLVRPVQMQAEIENFFGLGAGSSVDFTVSSRGGGNVLVDNLQVLGGAAVFKAYPSVPVTLKAVPNSGAAFTGWSDGDTNAERVVNVDGPVTLEAVFGSAF
ncbi:MAG: CotH kinase family protein [Chitinispirillia bacterium]|nr:CotH kinase family protein [Chitinispirillia bacterium]